MEALMLTEQFFNRAMIVFTVLWALALAFGIATGSLLVLVVSTTAWALLTAVAASFAQTLAARRKI